MFPARLAFIKPLAPSASVRPRVISKWDGFRFQAIKDAAGIRFFSRQGADYTHLLPRMVEAFAKLHAESAILDGELVLIDARGAAHFYKLMAQMRTSHPDEAQLMFMAFDLLHQDGVDLRHLPLSERKRDLHRLCTKSKVPFLKEVQTFSSGELLFEHCNKFGFEGVVTKRLSSRYMSGPSRLWTKSKCPDWKRDNANRYELFEKPSKPLGPTERERALQRKRAELVRVRESLARVGLRAGLFAALKAQERALLQEIAELEAK